MISPEDIDILRKVLGDELTRKLAPVELVDWLEERRENCMRHSYAKTKEERRGWLEDAGYFLRAKEAAQRLVWQPISTAPKDGTLILGFAIVDSATGNWKMRIMSHDHYAEVGMRQNWGGWGDSWVGPTHWMPLPEIPSIAGATREP